MADKKYFRYTNSNEDPMSDWGHAMFADSLDKVNYHGFYGHYAWTFESTTNTKNIEDLTDAIKAAWAAELENYAERGYYSSDFGDDVTHWLDEELDADELVELLNPDSIVTSADAWDCDLGVWFYAKIGDALGLDAVITNDGAIVWNQAAIKRDAANDW